MKAFITKYALTKGIIEADGEISGTHAPMFCIPGSYMAHYHGNDWHIKREDAIKRAEEMKIAKLKSLDKQVKKISKIEF